MPRRKAILDFANAPRLKWTGSHAQFRAAVIQVQPPVPAANLAQRQLPQLKVTVLVPDHLRRASYAE